MQTIYLKRQSPIYQFCWRLKKSVAGTKIYSPTLTKGEWKEELQKKARCI